MNDGQLGILIVAALMHVVALFYVSSAISSVVGALNGIRDEMRKTRRKDHVT